MRKPKQTEADFLEPQDLWRLRLSNAEFAREHERLARTKAERELAVREAEVALLQAQLKYVQAQRTMSDTMRHAQSVFDEALDGQKKLAAEIAERYHQDGNKMAFDPDTGQLMPLPGELHGDSPAPSARS